MTHRARSDEKVQFAPVLSCAGGVQGTTSLPVVFGLLGTLVVPTKQTLAVNAGALLKAGMTKR